MTTTNFMFQLVLALSALLGSTVSAMTLDDMIVDLEENLDKGGNCEAGSIDAVLNSEPASCHAFATLINAIIEANGSSSAASSSILLDSVVISDSYFNGMENKFLEEGNADLTFIPRYPVNYDTHGCNIEDVKSIGDIATNQIVGHRSDPKCIENRVNEAEAIQMTFKVTGGDISVTNSDAGTGTDAPPTSDPEADSRGNSKGITDAIPEEITNKTIDTTADGKDDNAPSIDEDVPMDLSNPGVQDGDEPLQTEGIPLEIPFEAGYSDIPFDTTDLPNHESADFQDLECVNQTFVLNKVPSISEGADTVTTSRRIAEQVFLINQKLLDYADVEQANYMASCEENGGVYRVVNTTTLCRRRSIFDSRIRQRVNYIGRNFPVCAGLQCEGKSDNDFGIVFAESLLTGNEFWDQTGEGEFWTCSDAFATSFQAIVGLSFAAAWYLL